MSNAPPGLLPNLIRGGAVVRLPIGRIAVLIRVKVFFRFGRNNLMNPPNRSIRTLVAGRDHQLGSKSTKNALALVGGAVRQAKLHAVAKRRADHGVGNPRIATGGIDDGLAKPQITARQTGLDHAQRRPVLDRTTGVEPLGLGIELHIGEFATDSRKTQKRRVPNQFKYRLTRSA